MAAVKPLARSVPRSDHGPTNARIGIPQRFVDAQLRLGPDGGLRIEDLSAPTINAPV